MQDAALIRTEIFRWKLTAVASESQREMECSVNALAAISLSLLIEREELSFGALFFKPSTPGLLRAEKMAILSGPPPYQSPYHPFSIPPGTPIVQNQ